jgi:hypothetical protein
MGLNSNSLLLRTSTQGLPARNPLKETKSRRKRNGASSKLRTIISKKTRVRFTETASITSLWGVTRCQAFQIWDKVESSGKDTRSTNLTRMTLQETSTSRRLLKSKNTSKLRSLFTLWKSIYTEKSTFKPWGWNSSRGKLKLGSGTLGKAFLCLL